MSGFGSIIVIAGVIALVVICIRVIRKDGDSCDGDCGSCSGKCNNEEILITIKRKKKES